MCTLSIPFIHFLPKYQVGLGSVFTSSRFIQFPFVTHAMEGAHAVDAAVGSTMRATQADGSRRLALVLCAFPHSDSYQIEYDDGSEAILPASALSPLLPWESSPSPESPAPLEDALALAERLKAQGNQLFALKDFASALRQYVLALKTIGADASLSPGARCLVRRGEGSNAPPRAALVLTIDRQTVEESKLPLYSSLHPHSIDLHLPNSLPRALADGGTLCLEYEPSLSSSLLPAHGALSERLVSLLSKAERMAVGEGIGEMGYGKETEESGEQAGIVEEDGVPVSLVVMVIHQRAALLQCALLLNASKCSLACREWGAAAARAARAELIAAGHVGEVERAAALRRTALLVSARAALGMQRFG